MEEELSCHATTHESSPSMHDMDKLGTSISGVNLRVSRAILVAMNYISWPR